MPSNNELADRINALLPAYRVKDRELADLEAKLEKRMAAHARLRPDAEARIAHFKSETLKSMRIERMVLTSEIADYQRRIASRTMALKSKIRRDMQLGKLPPSLDATITGGESMRPAESSNSNSATTAPQISPTPTDEQDRI